MEQALAAMKAVGRGVLALAAMPQVFNLVLLMALAVLVFRNLTKLHFERRRRDMGEG